MINIELDFINILNRDDMHKYFKEKFSFPDYYGENLDGLWDLLSEENDEMQISIYNGDILMERLESYGASVIDLFRELEVENRNISIEIIK